MKRRDFIVAIGSLAVVQPLAGYAQQESRKAHIAYFAVSRTDHLV